MTTFQNGATYQGYACQSVQYTRSAGMQADRGFITIDLGILKNIAVAANAIPWVGVSSEELPGATSFFSPSLRTGALGPAPDLEVPDDGLNIAGELVLSSIDADTGSAFPSHKYSAIFVDETGIEEVEQDLASQSLHVEGLVRVPIVDIRKFWWVYGIAGQSLNLRTKIGRLNASTMRSENCEVTGGASFKDVVKWMLGSLPGSPRLVEGSAMDTLDPPSNLIMRGQLVAPYLQKLLEDNSLVLLLQPDSGVVIAPKIVEDVPRHQIPRDFETFEAGKDLHAEKKSVFLNQRPPMVHVIGSPRVKRKSAPYIPIFQDEHGRYFKLDDIQKQWGYKLDDLNNSALVNPQKSFADCPPDLAVDGVLKRTRIELLRKWAYKGYAPAFAFNVTDCSRFDSKTKIQFITDVDFDQMQFLPMMNFPATFKQLENSSEQIPLDADLIPGDTGEMMLRGPLVYGSIITEARFNDIEAVRDYFLGPKGLLAARRNTQAHLNEWLSAIITDGQALIKANIRSEDLINVDSTEFVARFGNDSRKVASVGADLTVAAAAFGVSFASQRLFVNSDFLLSPAFRAELGATLKEKEEVQNQIDAILAEIDGFQVAFDDAEKAIIGGVGILVKHQIARRRLPEGTYNLDPNTGILVFSEVSASMNRPFVYETEYARVTGPGFPAVTWGYELKHNIFEDLTSVMFVASDDTATAVPSYCGLNRGSPIKSRPVHDPNLVLYEGDAGQPHNGTDVIATARARISGIFKVPIQSEGYVYTWHGFEKAALAPGITAVSHQFDGDTALTIIGVNAIGARLGEMPPATVSQSPYRTRAIGQQVEATNDTLKTQDIRL